MRDRMSEIFSLTSGNGCFQSPLFSYHVTKKLQALGTRMRKRKLKELTHRARSIQTKFPEISVQNSMDQFGPTGKVLKKLVHLLRWTTFPGPTGRKFWLNMDRVHIVVRFITIILSDGLTSIRSGRISWRMNFYWDISKQWKKREICRCVFTCFEKLEEIDKNLDLLQVNLLFERRGRERSSCSDEWLFWKSIKIVLITR